MDDTGHVRSPAEMDAVIAAHRQLLILLLSTIAENETMRARLAARIEQRELFRDAHEDPGVEADGAVAFEVAVEREMTRILDDVRSALAAETGKTL
ncbi:hypothetical protein [Azorhizobium oxalatiphilum]|nr:hypothetical protein [Azorhizobium oxalatiphilum]